MTDTEFQGILDKYLDVPGVAPLHTWTSGDLTRVTCAIDHELMRRAHEEGCRDGQYDDC
jgi:hypothetical protein